MVVYFLCGLAKTLQFLNQQEKLLPHGLQQAFTFVREWDAKLVFCFLIGDKSLK